MLRVVLHDPAPIRVHSTNTPLMTCMPACMSLMLGSLVFKTKGCISGNTMHIRMCCQIWPCPVGIVGCISNVSVLESILTSLAHTLHNAPLMTGLPLHHA